MNEQFAIPEDKTSGGAPAPTYRVELVQKHNNGTPRWLTDGPWGILTAVAKRALQFYSESAAADVAARTPPHPWGKWEARAYA